MQVDSKTLELYKKSAPELLEAVESDGDVGFVMRKEPQSGCCVKLENGKCSIQAKYGEEFLGDACFLYPRITRSVGDSCIVTATMSCPEIARAVLYREDRILFENFSAPRIPQEVRNIFSDGLTLDDVINVHSSFLAATKDESASAVKVFARIASVSRSLQRVEQKDWARAVQLYFRLADSSVPAPEKNINDPFNLLHSLCGLVAASKKPVPPRLKQTISEIEQALCVSLDWKNVLIKTSDESLEAYNKIRKLWDSGAEEKYSSLFKKWLAAQFSASLYPFAGLGQTLSERITIIGVRFAILRLAFMSLYSINGGDPHQDDVVRVTQSLSRFLDHLADPEFSLRIYAETGWGRENRMIGLLY